MVNNPSREGQSTATPYMGMAQRFGGSWQTALVVGLVTLVLGVIIVAWPGVTIAVLAVLFAIQLLLLGIFNLVRSIASGEAPSGTRVLFAVVGVLSIALGVLALRHPFQTLQVIAILFGLVWLISGIIEFISLVSGPQRRGRSWSIVLAILTVIAGIIVLSYPAPSLVTLALIVGIWLIVWGIITICLAVAARLAERHPAPRTTAHP